MEFTFDKFTVAEQNKSINAAVYRHGDLSYQSSVICYTRQRTAQVMMDYEERFLSEASRIVFKPGDRVCSFYVHKLRKTIEGYLESVPSQTFNTIKT